LDETRRTTLQSVGLEFINMTGSYGMRANKLIPCAGILCLTLIATAIVQGDTFNLQLTSLTESANDEALLRTAIRRGEVFLQTYHQTTQFGLAGQELGRTVTSTFVLAGQIPIAGAGAKGLQVVDAVNATVSVPINVNFPANARRTIVLAFVRGNNVTSIVPSITLSAAGDFTHTMRVAVPRPEEMQYRYTYTYPRRRRLFRRCAAIQAPCRVSMVPTPAQSAPSQTASTTAQLAGTGTLSKRDSIFGIPRMD
jgi:hypothetical protein